MKKQLFTLLFLVLAAYAQVQQRVAIINTLDDRDSISVANLTYLTDRLRETAVNVLPSERFGVMTTESIIAFLGSQERAVKVCKESSCLAELGRQVSADYVAQGRIGRFGENLTIKVELYNVKTGNLMGSFTGNFKDIYSSLALIDEKAPDLFKKMLVEPKAPKPEPSPVVVPVPQKPVDIANIQALIKKDIDKYKEKIQEESIHLSHGDKMVLYEGNREKWAPLGWGMLNGITLGSGLGNYMQGNISVGVIHSLFGVLGGLFLVIGPKKGTDENYDEEYEFRKNFFIGVVGVNWLASIFTPLFYGKVYNKTLREALNIDEEDIISIAPIIIPKNGPPAVGLAFNVRY